VASLPDFISRLLWDVDVSALDEGRDSALILERVMSRGSWEAMKWLRARYPQSLIADFVTRHGARKLSPRDLAYWAAVSGVSVDAGTGGGRPSWAG
jgi:hypothetical protein